MSWQCWNRCQTPVPTLFQGLQTCPLWTLVPSSHTYCHIPSHSITGSIHLESCNVQFTVSYLICQVLFIVSDYPGLVIASYWILLHIMSLFNQLAFCLFLILPLLYNLSTRFCNNQFHLHLHSSQPPDTVLYFAKYTQYFKTYKYKGFTKIH